VGIQGKQSPGVRPHSRAEVKPSVPRACVGKDDSPKVVAKAVLDVPYLEEEVGQVSEQVHHWKKGLWSRTRKPKVYVPMLHLQSVVLMRDSGDRPSDRSAITWRTEGAAQKSGWQYEQYLNWGKLYWRGSIL